MKKFLFLLLLIPFLGIGQTDYCDLDFTPPIENDALSAQTIQSFSTAALSQNDTFGVFYNSSSGLQCVGSATYTDGFIQFDIYSTDENNFLTGDQLVFIVQSGSTISFIETSQTYLTDEQRDQIQ